MRWIVSSKADIRPRLLADRHYTRQSPGSRMWTRPGYVQILYAEQRSGRAAAFCWWRPRWEFGAEFGYTGSQRKDKLRCIECTLFRNETRYRSSDLIREAVQFVLAWEHAQDTEWPDGLISGVGSAQTAAGRAANHPPGYCFLMAGWLPFEHPGRNIRADTWLQLPREQCT